jgi:murein peptide amidase A
MIAPALESFIFGMTSTGLPIPAYRFGPRGAPRVLVIGGVHGDEIEGVWAAHGLLAAFALKFPYHLDLTLVPAFNLDGVLARDRRNARGVDLNRNLPSNDWTSEVATERYNPGPAACSEPENKALVTFFEREKPAFVISLHSWKPMLNINGDCRAEAEAIRLATGYVIEESIGYPTPGCLGTYAGLERAMPTLTYEIERGLDQASILKIHVPAIQDALVVAQSR